MVNVSIKRLNEKGPDDVIERFFSWGEKALCSPQSVQALAQEEVQDPDVLDYVFEHVESFTCAEEQPGAYLRQNDTFDTYGQNSLVRENSLVENGPTGSPQRMTTTRKQHSNKLAPFGQEGDLLDYCFEHVESYVEAHACAEGSVVAETNGKSREQLALEARAQAAIEHQIALQRRTAAAIKEQEVKQRNDGWLRSAIARRTSRERTSESSHPIPTEISTRKKKVRPPQNYYLEPEEEESIMLYYRPQKRH